MNTTYLLILILGAVATTALFAIRLKKEQIGAGVAFLTTLLGAVLGFLCAKVICYALTNSDFGAENQMSFFGGCAGVVLAVFLIAKITKNDVSALMDAFAPAGALMVYFARVGEYFLDEVGIRSDIETAALKHFPFAVQNEWEEWNLAVFFLEALIALIVCVVFLVRKKENAVAGLRMERVLFYLCLPQVFCESLRSDSLMLSIVHILSFVRAEQLLCAVVFTGLLVRACRKSGRKGFWPAYWPVAVDVLCIAVMIGVEFALDGKLGEIPLAASYGVMVLALLVLAGCEIHLSRRRIRNAS